MPHAMHAGILCSALKSWQVVTTRQWSSCMPQHWLLHMTLLALKALAWLGILATPNIYMLGKQLCACHKLTPVAKLVLQQWCKAQHVSRDRLLTKDYFVDSCIKSPFPQDELFDNVLVVAVKQLGVVTTEPRVWISACTCTAVIWTVDALLMLRCIVVSLSQMWVACLQA